MKNLPFELFAKTLDNMADNDINQLCQTNKEFNFKCEEYYKSKLKKLLLLFGKNYREIYNHIFHPPQQYMVMLIVHDFPNYIIGVYNSLKKAKQQAKNVCLDQDEECFEYFDSLWAQDKHYISSFRTHEDYQESDIVIMKIPKLGEFFKIKNNSV